MDSEDFFGGRDFGHISLIFEWALMPTGSDKTARMTVGETADISSDEPRSIVICGMNYAPEMAGVGRYTGEIAEYLVAQGMKVAVVTTPPHYPGWKVQSGYRNRYSTSSSNGVDIYRCPVIVRENMKGIWRLIAPLSFAIASAPVAFCTIIRRRPETVICIEPTLFVAPIAQLAAKIVGSRVILHVQDLEVDAAFAVGHLNSRAWIKRLGYAFERATLKHFDKIVTISNSMAERLVSKGLAKSKITVVRNWVNLSHIFPLVEKSAYREELGFSEDDFVLLYSGNIGAKQGLDVLLEAAEELTYETKIHFVIAGEGPFKASLQRRFSYLANVHFLGFQPYSRLNEFLNMPDLHILPQERGAADLVLPSKLGGMLASGRRILVTADEGTELAEFVQGAAKVIPPGDARLMALAIKKATNERDLPRSSDTQRFRAQQLGMDDGLSRFISALIWM